MSLLIPHSRPTLGAAEAAAAAETVRSGAVAQGVQVAAFEEEVAARLGRAGAVAVSSGTMALVLALRALGVRGGDVVIPSYVCSALLHAVRHAGARPWLADVTEPDGNLAAGAALPPAARALVVPHMFGVPAPVAALSAAGVPLVEDLAMALGTDGVGVQGRVGICSFYATKVITSGGEGGMVVADDEGLLAAVRELRQYDGRDPEVLRWNAKLTDLAAAIGRVQLRRLDDFVARRRALQNRYLTILADSGVGLPCVPPAGNGYRFVLRLPEGRGVTPLIEALQVQGIECRRPVDRPLHRWLGLEDGGFPVTTRLWERSLSLPIYPSLRQEDVDRVGRSLTAWMRDGGAA